MPRGDVRPARVPKDVRHYVAQWTSPHLPTRDALALARRVVRQQRPQSLSEAARWLEAIALLLAYLTEQGVHLTAATPNERLFAESHLAGLEQDLRRRRAAGEIKASTLNTYLSRLAVLVKRAGVESQLLDRPGRGPRTEPATKALPDAGFAAWLRVAELQRDPIRVQFLAMLCCCRGAGLDGTDLRWVRGTSIVRRRDGALAIGVLGPNRRDVVVLDRYADLLEALGRRCGDDLLLGQWQERNNPTGDLLDSVQGGHDLPRPTARALRKAYVEEMLHTPGLETVRLHEQLGRSSLSELETSLSAVPRHLFGDNALRAGCPQEHS